MTRVALLASTIGLSIFVGSFSMQSSEIRGRAHVLDGDTLVIGGTHIRLAGIDAPELQQTCLQHNGVLWHCGVAAKTSLEYIVGEDEILCYRDSTDKYNRTIATCFDITGADIGRQLVRVGMAVAYTRYSSKYVPEQQAASRDRTGIWDSHFTSPEVFRYKGDN